MPMVGLLLNVNRRAVQASEEFLRRLQKDFGAGGGRGAAHLGEPSLGQFRSGERGRLNTFFSPPL
jgi:hypothetical protein